MSRPKYGDVLCNGDGGDIVMVVRANDGARDGVCVWLSGPMEPHWRRITGNVLGFNSQHRSWREVVEDAQEADD